MSGLPPPAVVPPPAPASLGDVPPSQTLYINNLNEKIRVDELKKGLYHVFSQYGEILEVMCKKTYRMRGQAWIVFSDIGGSARAMKEMQGFLFFGKPMRCNFAKVKSDVVAKADGTFQARPKRKTEDEKDAKPHLSSKKKAAAPKPVSSTSNASAPMQQLQDSSEPPNRILFVQNVPEEVTQQMLSMLFGQVQGFKEVRLVAGKKGIAFVEYGDEYCAGKALETLQNFKITPTHQMRISYAKRG